MKDYSEYVEEFRLNGFFNSIKPDSKYYNDREAFMDRIKERYGWTYYDTVPNHLKDEEMVLYLLKNILTEDIDTFKFIINTTPKRLFTLNVVKVILNVFPDFLLMLPNELITEELCYEAIYNRGRGGLRYVPEQYKTYDLCLQANVNCSQNIEFTPDKHKYKKGMSFYSKRNTL